MVLYFTIGMGWHNWVKINFTFLKSRVQSLAFSPNCHLHCVSASYSSPGNFSGYGYSLTALGSSDRHRAWAELEEKRGEWKKSVDKDGNSKNEGKGQGRSGEECRVENNY